jgi:tripartite ATP-independent transporter DctM subunit
MTTDPVGIALLIGLFAFLVIIKFPIAFCLALSAFATAFYLNIPLSAVTQKMVASVDSFSLLAIPFFILAGEIMSSGGISDRIVALSNVLVGRVRGGLAMVNCLESIFFGMVSGSAVADVSSTGPIVIPMMKKQGYPVPFAVALTVASAAMSLLIPPSHNMIIFATAIGGISVGKLFMAGLVPGYLLGVLLMIYCAIMSKIKNYPKSGKYTLKEALKIARESLLGMFTMVIVVGGVFAGIVTATESAVLACAWAFIIALCVYKEITIKDLIPILKRALQTIALVMALVASAGAFGFIMTWLRIPDLITGVLLSITQNKYLLLLLINLSLLTFGTIMDMAPLILICAPVLLPVVTSPIIGMDPVHFGVMLIYNLGIGLCTPPVGTMLFVGSAIGRIRIEETVKALMPFYIVMFIGLLLVTYIPAISMTIPNLMFGN